MNKAIFLDRDGTINFDSGYITSADELQLLPGVVEALKYLKDSGFLLIVVTNQSAVGRGLCSLESCESVNSHLYNLLAKQGVELDQFYICPHAPWEGCKCRKPSSYLLELAIEKYSIDREKSFMFGDKTSDVECGEAAGIKSYLVSDSQSLLYHCNQLFKCNL